ncbi:MAG: hypothetical protein GX358_05925 [candidate division WS1 bacterium]|nr:hypothetical protein [candidate division WS1 bacterium]
MGSTLRALAERSKVATDMLELERQAQSAVAQYKAAVANLEKLAGELDGDDAAEVRGVKQALEAAAEEAGIGGRK